MNQVESLYLSQPIQSSPYQRGFPATYSPVVPSPLGNGTQDWSTPHGLVAGPDQSNHSALFQNTPVLSQQHQQAPAPGPAEASKHFTPPQSHAGSASPQKRPMAAPPLPQSPHSTAVASPGASSLPASPRSAADAARERERVALLLDINLSLLQEMSKLQSQGKAGAANAQQAAVLRSQGLPDKMAADEYIQVFYRLQSNLGYLYSQPDMQLLNPQNQNNPNAGRKGPPHPPQFMWPPPSMPSLGDKYAALRGLFPGWVGRDAPQPQ